MFLPLFVLELRRAPAGPRRPGRGWALLATALLAELLLVGGGFTRAARPALPVAAWGMACIQGRPALRATALLLWFVPVPSELVSWASPGLETAWARAAAGVAQLFGSDVSFEPVAGSAALHAGPGTLVLGPSDGGLSLAALATGLVWYAGLRRGVPAARTAGVGLALGALAFPYQILALALAAPHAGAVAPLRVALDVVPWVVVLVAGLTMAAGPRARAPGSDDEPLSSARP